MRIAFVSANRENLPDAVIPLGLLYVMANTPPEHDKVLWDLCFEDDPHAALAARLQAWQPDLVAVGMRNVQSNDYSGCSDNLKYYRQLFDTIRRHSAAPVVLGGGGFSVMPEPLMHHLQPDFGIAGEGELAFARLLEALTRGDGNFAQVPNLYRLRHAPDGSEQVTRTPPAAQFLDLDALAVPDRSLVDPRHYAHYGIDSVQTKRGCALQCDYCTYPTIEGNVTRRRGPARVVEEMVEARRLQPGIRHVFIVDSVFNLPPSHAKAVCRELIDRGWEVPWTAYANPIAFDAELAGLMVAAGCKGVEVGSDSGVDTVLARLKKGFTTAAIRRMHDTCARAGLPDCHTFILGTPGESLADVAETLDFCRELDPVAAILMTWVDDYEALDPVLAASRRVLRDAVQDVLRGKQREFPRWIFPQLGVNFDPQLFAFLRRRGLAGPLWQSIWMIGERRRQAPRTAHR